MRKLIMKMSMSLDGFVSGPNAGNDWVFKTGDEESKAWSVGQIREAGLIIMGRKSFEGLATYWPTAPGPFAAPMKEIMRSLIATVLIDEYVLGIHPVALGSGLPIFTELATPLYLKLVDVKTFPKGTMAKTFHPA